MPDFQREILNAELPDGTALKAKEDGGLDLFFDGVSDNWDEVRVFLKELQSLRNAEDTTILDDLEREYGIERNTSLTDAERRERLRAVQTEGVSLGTDDDLQAKLRAAGFSDLYVHSNDPAVDPKLFIFNEYLIVCGRADSVCGNPEAVCGSILDDLIVNGNIYISDTGLLPSDSGYWHLISFVGGVATRDPSTNELTSIARVVLPVDRRDELRRLIVKYKPLHSWIGLVAEFV